jgi:hypothetical protein
MRGGDDFGLGVLALFVIVIVLSGAIGLFKAIIASPWLIAVCIFAVLVYFLARRADRNYGGPTYRRNDDNSRR